MKENLEERFDRQYAEPETLERGLHVYDLEPPDGMISGPPVVFLEGVMPNPPAHKRFLWNLYRHGRRVLVAHSPHGVSAKPPRGRDFAEPQWRKAMAVLRMLDHKKIVSATAVAYSEGAIVFRMLADWLGGSVLFPNVVLIEPAGVIQDDPRDLMKRADEERRQEEVRHRQGLTQYWWESNSRDWRYYILWTPIRTWRETKTLAAADIRGSLTAFRQHGMRVGLLQGDLSITYPRSRVLAAVGSAEVDKIVIVPRGYHHDLMLQPMKCATATYKLIVDLESMNG